MYENKCAICGQSILGYWYPVGKNNICQSCGAANTIYDLYMRDLLPIQPDIIDGAVTLVTKGEESAKVELDKAKLGTYVDATSEETEKFFESSEPMFNT